MLLNAKNVSIFHRITLTESTFVFVIKVYLIPVRVYENWLEQYQLRWMVVGKCRVASPFTLVCIYTCFIHCPPETTRTEIRYVLLFEYYWQPVIWDYTSSLRPLWCILGFNQRKNSNEIPWSKVIELKRKISLENALFGRHFCDWEK